MEALFSRLRVFGTGLSGWRRRGFLFLLGALLTLGLPPFDIWPVAFVILPFLIWLLEGAASRRSAFGVGWWFSFGYFMVGWYWISNALLVFSDAFWWMIPFALVGLPGVMAVYGGLAALAVHMAVGPGPDRRLARILLATVAFALADFARGTLLTGFPWNSFGYLWSGTEALSQAAALIGVGGLGILVLLSGFGPALCAGAGRAWVPLAASLLLPAAVFAGGAVRLGGAPNMAAYQEDTALPGIRMVQPNIPQREKWARDHRLRNFEMHLEDSAADRPDWVGTVLWPETAAAFLIEEEEAFRTQAARFAAPDGGYLITGAPRIVRTPRALHNAIVVLNGTGAVVETYDKAHLVPFGEYVPFSEYLPIDSVAGGALNYSPGPGPRTLTLAGLPPFSPLICYEVIFPGAVIDRSDRPAWILNATNDAWYGVSTGPYQHLQHARMRAVEEGLPLVRPASTGVSVAYDAYGREIGRIPLETRGILDFRLPPALPETFYAQWGREAIAATLVLLLGFGLVALRKRVV